MIRYANYLFIIFININENIRYESKTTHISAAIYLNVIFYYLVGKLSIL